VVHEPGFGAPAPDRHLERVNDELGAHVRLIAQPTIALENASWTTAR